MRALVTGAAGFIGSNLVKRCLAEGWDVTGVDNLSNGHREFLPEGYRDSMAGFWHIDFAARSVIEAVKEQQFDVVVHLAAVPRVSYSVEHPVETHDINVTRTLKLLDACRGNVKRFVFASSSSVYGGANRLPTHESHPKNPRSPYALQKSIIEGYCELYGELYGLDTACLRFFNVFGPMQIAGGAYATAVSAWLDAIKRGRPMRSDGDGSQSRDMCYVDNVTDACVKAAACKQDLMARCFNVACGDRTTNAEILAYMTKRYPGSSFGDAPWRPGDVMHTQADVRRAEEEIGYMPLVRFWEGLERTCDWHDANWSWVKDLKQGM